MLAQLGIIAAGLVALFFPRQAQAGIFSQKAEKYGPALPASGLPVNKNDLDTLARTIWGEARGEGRAGMQAVANVIMNRFKLSQQSTVYARNFGGGSVANICKKKNQFSTWMKHDPDHLRNYLAMMAVTESDPQFREAVSIARQALQYRLTDITNGADHYLNVAATRKARRGSLPSWVRLERRTADIGSHTFLRLA